MLIRKSQHKRVETEEEIKQQEQEISKVKDFGLVINPHRKPSSTREPHAKFLTCVLNKAEGFFFSNVSKKNGKLRSGDLTKEEKPLVEITRRFASTTKPHTCNDEVVFFWKLDKYVLFSFQFSTLLISRLILSPKTAAVI